MVQAGSGNRKNTSNLSLINSLSPDERERAARSITEELIDDAILNVVFEVHRSLKKGVFQLEFGTKEEDEKFLQVTTEGLDVFGQAPAKKQHECVCPNCSRNLAASRFAPHLEKCMGMGRNSSRIASRRIQSNSRDNSNSHSTAGAGGSDEDDDDDWMMDRKRRKRDKNSPRRSRLSKMKLDGISTSNGTATSFESILTTGTIEEKRIVLSQICGVMSEHTRKMCVRSLRCPQHSGEQRRLLRDQLLATGDDSIAAGNSTTRADSTSGNGRTIQDMDDVQVDIDGLDEAHLGSSWDHDLSNTTSPADSTSTNNSTSSTNKRTNNKSRKKSSKSSKSSNSSHGSLLD